MSRDDYGGMFVHYGLRHRGLPHPVGRIPSVVIFVDRGNGVGKGAYLFAVDHKHDVTSRCAWN